MWIFIAVLIGMAVCAFMYGCVQLGKKLNNKDPR